MYAEYGKRHIEVEKRRLRPFQFLATVTAKCAGNEDADFMAEESIPEVIPGAFEAFLEAKAKASGKLQTNTDIVGGAEGTTEADAPIGSSA